MATISETERYAELLTHVDYHDWWVFVVGAAEVIEQWTGEKDPARVVGLIEAKKQGVDLTQFHWRAYLWQLGAEADFLERLERAVGQV